MNNGNRLGVLEGDPRSQCRVHCAPSLISSAPIFPSEVMHVSPTCRPDQSRACRGAP
ncbi:hypothetical protein B0H17DRAFT_1104345 [Mycena rosella]|uniref:Uncharacterized protein n=1 Tax=Mycena rosella TaxID=1033263 RepID=A0AAD7FVF0_MYCRO|nr:hypothetical protein B0H17DRAFT_1104345 [Mycena rosella]